MFTSITGRDRLRGAEDDSHRSFSSRCVSDRSGLSLSVCLCVCVSVCLSVCRPCHRRSAWRHADRDDGLCCSRTGGRPTKAPLKSHRSRRSGYVTDKMRLIRGRYKHTHTHTRAGKVSTHSSSHSDPTGKTHANCPSTTVAPMGLSLSMWLHHRAADIPPPPSSAFKPRAVPASSRLAITLNSAPVSPADRRSHWSSVHRSPNLLLSQCKQEVTRSPAELSSDGVRAEAGVRSGLHVWEVVWSPRHRGSHAVLGVSKQDCPLQASGYNALVGGDLQSWGWELKTNQLWHGGQTLDVYPAEKRRNHREATEGLTAQPDTIHNTTGVKTPLLIPECILMVLDADAGTLGFVVDGFFLGVAFKDLPRGVELFPAVSSVRGGANIRLRYLNGTPCDPPALMALCGLSIQQCLGQQWQTDKLPLPPVLQHYLLPHH